MIIERVVNTTYGVMAEALHQLGFTESHGENSFGFPYVAYNHSQSGAIIIIPVRPPQEAMYGGHFIVALRTIENWGIADEETFSQTLREVAQKQVQAA